MFGTRTVKHHNYN